jgi:sigma-B regulation protein RsbU (phosphoserine phosphatase)
VPNDHPIRALLVEDNAGDARLIREMLRESRAGQPVVELTHVDRLAAGLEHLATDEADVVLLDLTLPDSRGFDTFARTHAAAPDVPIVVLSGLDDEDTAVRAVHAGAQDYLVKGRVDGALLVRAMRYAIERQTLQTVRHELERQRDEFFASVSHDLRTPVAAIKAAIGVVLANEPPGMSPALHRLLGNIDLAADELASLIDDLLEIARLQAGRVELWRTDVDLRELVQRAVRPLETLVDARSQQLELVLTLDPVVASVDGERFARVVRNLVGNAQKYSRDGGRIRVSLEREADGVCLAVADDGPGIPLDEQARIFERFYRARRADAAGPLGSGLGLPIARALVELHGGELSVDSVEGQGSTFRVRLPASPSSHPAG